MTTSFTFADLFAGIGGFHAALSALGGQCVLAVEKDPEASRVYHDNWGMSLLGDVTEVDWQAAPDFDVLTAGFPCQPFSKSGSQRGMDETRGTLFFEICKALEAKRPSVILLENVRNLAGPRHTHEWDIIIQSLRELGYRVSSTPLIVSPSWLDPSHGGTPQNRERVFILGTYDPEHAALDTPLTVSLVKRLTEWTLASDLPLDGTTTTSTTSLPAAEIVWLEAWNDFVLQARARAVPLPGFPLWADVWNSTLRSGHHPAWKERFIELNTKFHLANQDWIDPWLLRHDIAVFPVSRRKLEWQGQDAPSFQDCLITMRPSGLRVKRATHTGALVAIDQRPIVGSLSRRLSVRECARLQGLPDSFSFSSVPDKAAYKQLGNGVCVGAAYFVLREHLLHPETQRVLGLENPLIQSALVTNPTPNLKPPI